MQLQVGVKVLLRNKDTNILLLKRFEEKYPGVGSIWDIPGGRIDPGSPLLENLNREIDEETKLSLTSAPKLIAAQDIMPTEDRHIVRLTYVAQTEGEPILDLQEHTEYKWVSFEELKNEQQLDHYVQALIENRILTETSWN